MSPDERLAAAERAAHAAAERAERSRRLWEQTAARLKRDGHPDRMSRQEAERLVYGQVSPGFNERLGV